MALPADYPPPPRPPPASVPPEDRAWYNYAVDMQRYVAALVVALK